MSKVQHNIFDMWKFSHAEMSDDRKYRYLLTRSKGTSASRVAFCMLNPSTADEILNDPTIKRCIGFADAWGFSKLLVVNLFALRSTDPKALRVDDDPIGLENDSYIHRACIGSTMFVCAWGTHGALNNRGKTILDTLHSNYRSITNIRHLGLTKHGHPKHPLYLRADTKPMEF